MTRKMGLPYKGLIVQYHKRIAQSVTLLFVIVIGLSLGSMAFKNALVDQLQLHPGVRAPFTSSSYEIG